MDIKELLFGILAITVFYGFSRLFGRRKRYLLKNGYSEVATVTSIEQTIYSVSSGSSLDKRVYEIDLKIAAKGEPIRIVTTRQAFETYGAVPQPGDKVNILVDPKNPDNVMLSPN
jgi:hypothetical protein